MKIIKRKYLQDIIDVMGIPDIKVITDTRRSGKSELLHMFDDYVNNKDVYPKMIIARRKHYDYQYEYIKIVDITNWLDKVT